MHEQTIGICGIGAVTGYGWGREALWDGLVAGKPAATLRDDYTTRVGDACWVAAVPDGGDPDDGRSRFARAMRTAAREAIEDATARGWVAGERVGLLHAVVLGEVDLWRDFYLAEEGSLRVRDYLSLMPSTPMSLFMQEYGFHGPAMNVSAMCASGNAGLLTAQAWLDAGIVDDVVLVATDLSLTPENVEHFVRLGVAVVDAEPLSACRPFQEGSRGFVMGEASIGMVLSRRGGAPYARLLGGAMSHDAHHLTSIDPSLHQVRRCFGEAMTAAGVDPKEVRFVNAHGPGTLQCDTAEAAVLEELFPAETGIYSVKPFTAHCQAAASSVELAVAAFGYDRGVVHAPPAVAEAHPRLLHGPFAVDEGLTVKSSLGMGGHNAVVVLAPA